MKAAPFGVAAMLLVAPAVARGQSADELAKQTQNPVASLISVPLQGNWDFGLGDRDATGHEAHEGHEVKPRDLQKSQTERTFGVFALE